MGYKTVRPWKKMVLTCSTVNLLTPGCRFVGLSPASFARSPRRRLGVIKRVACPVVDAKPAPKRKKGAAEEEGEGEGEGEGKAKKKAKS